MVAKKYAVKKTAQKKDKASPKADALRKLRESSVDAKGPYDKK